jgi:hypothetical protein
MKVEVALVTSVGGVTRTLVLVNLRGYAGAVPRNMEYLHSYLLLTDKLMMVDKLLWLLRNPSEGSVDIYDSP